MKGGASPRVGRASRPAFSSRGGSSGGGVSVGILLTGIEPASPALRGGVREGDVIVAVNGVRVAHKGDLLRALGPVLEEHAAPLSLHVWRPAGEGGELLALPPFAPIARPDGADLARKRASRWW